MFADDRFLARGQQAPSKFPVAISESTYNGFMLEKERVKMRGEVEGERSVFLYMIGGSFRDL